MSNNEIYIDHVSLMPNTPEEMALTLGVSLLDEKGFKSLGIKFRVVVGVDKVLNGEVDPYAGIFSAENIPVKTGETNLKLEISAYNGIESIQKSVIIDTEELLRRCSIKPVTEAEEKRIEKTKIIEAKNILLAINPRATNNDQKPSSSSRSAFNEPFAHTNTSTRILPHDIISSIEVLVKYSANPFAKDAMIEFAKQDCTSALLYLEHYVHLPWAKDVLVDALDVLGNADLVLKNVEKYEYQPWAEEVVKLAANKNPRAAMKYFDLYKYQPWAQEIKIYCDGKIQEISASEIDQLGLAENRIMMTTNSSDKNLLADFEIIVNAYDRHSDHVEKILANIAEKKALVIFTRRSTLARLPSSLYEKIILVATNSDPAAAIRFLNRDNEMRVLEIAVRKDPDAAIRHFYDRTEWERDLYSEKMFRIAVSLDPDAEKKYRREKFIEKLFSPLDAVKDFVADNVTKVLLATGATVAIAAGGFSIHKHFDRPKLERQDPEQKRRIKESILYIKDILMSISDENKDIGILVRKGVLGMNGLDESCSAARGDCHTETVSLGALLDALVEYGDSPIVKDTMIEFASKAPIKAMNEFSHFAKMPWAEEIVSIVIRKNPTAALNKFSSYEKFPWVKNIAFQIARENPDIFFDKIAIFEYQPWAHEAAKESATKNPNSAIDNFEKYKYQPWAQDLLKYSKEIVEVKPPVINPCTVPPCEPTEDPAK